MASLADNLKDLIEGGQLDKVEEVISNIRAMETQLEENKTALAERDAKISDLQDVNMKLFLSNTSEVNDPEPEEEKELTPEEALEELINLI